MQGGRSRFEVCTTHGPWGGSQGAKWVYRPPEGCIKQIKISVRHGGVVDSIEFETCLKTGETVSSVFGGKGGSRTDTICIDYPDEYLQSIAVTTGHKDGSVVVQSISFTTNRNRYGPFGTDRGTGSCGTERGNSPFATAFGGFGTERGTGSSGTERCNSPFGPAFGGFGTERGTGPFGGPFGTERGASPFGFFGTDRGTAPTVKPFGFGTDKGTVYSNDGKGGVIVGFHGRANEYLEAIGVYVMPESLALGPNSTYEDEVMPPEVNFDDKDEYLIGISGFYGPVKGCDGMEAITSISFHTNKRIHGPFGDEKGAGYTYYTSPACPGKVVGFHGRSNGFLSAIGVHMEYF
ncbi:hypothetical protein M8C21_004788 [Ambrosia artemisiifolia]|uniref:Jacalin-type lectin domain-containing protein n=1 Tax=Ambrosia artemisiifolia TaxID=4212 RepID=A0AAD5BVX9_AMBAR|nr:hypothetical protein M8C21_004788 [Ambrosia artemisiifolia]